MEKFLELGPGKKRITGFTTVNIVDGPNVDVVCDASKKLPFDDNTFSVVYASHVLEHIPWYQTEDVLREWKRVLVFGGSLEVWVPDAFKICRTVSQYEEEGIDSTELDGWYKFNEEHDPCKWAAGRLFTYGDGKGTIDHWNWHRAMFTPRYLCKVLINVGFELVEQLDRSCVRGEDHGWINLGFRGMKI